MGMLGSDSALEYLVLIQTPQWQRSFFPWRNCRLFSLRRRYWHHAIGLLSGRLLVQGLWVASFKVVLYAQFHTLVFQWNYCPGGKNLLSLKSLDSCAPPSQSLSELVTEIPDSSVREVVPSFQWSVFTTDASSRVVNLEVHKTGGSSRP